jgi:hypothetical protein
MIKRHCSAFGVDVNRSGNPERFIRALGAWLEMGRAEERSLYDSG